MSYAEFAHVLFRGHLEGATGTADFVLTADAIDAIDTLNIKNGAVAYQQVFRFSHSASLNTPIVTINLPVLDDGLWIEVTAYSNRLANIQINGVTQSRYNANGNCSFTPVMALSKVAKGTATIKLIANSSGVATGYAVVRYIRKTGSENG